MKYTYTARFADGTTFEQPKDDHSEIDPSKSATYDLIQHMKARDLQGLRLAGGGRVASVLLPSGTFEIDGREYKPGEWVPNGCEWVEGDPAQGHYFRRVTRRFDQDQREVGQPTVKFCIGAKAAPGVKNFISVS